MAVIGLPKHQDNKHIAVLTAKRGERDKDMTKERTITLEELFATAEKYGYWTMTVKDNSVRGATEKGIYDIDVGDRVLIDNYFVKVTL